MGVIEMRTKNTNFLTYVVRSQRLAGYLMMNGFKLHNMAEDRQGSGRNVFFFTNSKDLLDCIERYKQMK